MLDVRRLAVLAAVGRAGSMAGAATMMAFTPSAVSQQIAALERQVGAALVTRHARGVRLTQAGELLVDHTDAVLERLQRAETEIADLVGLRAGRLRMAAFATAAAALLPEAIGWFRRAHPDVGMSVDIREPPECTTLLRDGALDLAVGFEYSPTYGMDDLDVEGLRTVHLVDDPMHVALPADHQLAVTDGNAVDVAALRDESWIRDDGVQCREQLTLLCAAAGFEPRIALDSEDYAAVGRLVASGVGVALVPGLAADQMSEGTVLREVRPAVLRTISALLPANASPAAEAMVGMLVATLDGQDRSARSS